MKNPRIVARDEAVADAAGKNAETILRETGNNTGNLLFIAAVRRIVKYDTPSMGVGFNPRRIRETHDGIVIPAANWLQASKDWGRLADLIEQSALPCVVIGLGAQSRDTENKPNLTPGTLRFLKVVSERSRSISVRGEYTASVLDDLGIKNVRVTGCPSLLWWVDRTTSVQKENKRIANIVLHGTRSDNAKALFVSSVYRIGLFISRMAYLNGLDYVAQTELSDVIIGRDEDTENISWKNMRRIYGEKNVEKIRDYTRDHLRFFSNVHEWVAYMAENDFSIGTRLHGTIASLLAGTPAALITHDTRTSEMARWAAIPSIDKNNILKEDSIDFQKIYDSLDFAEFNSRQQSYYSEFREFFEENGVAHNLRTF